MKRKKILYCSLLMMLSTYGCDACKDEICRDIPAAYFSFNLIDANTGEDLIFGSNPINHPDSIVIQAQDDRRVEADKERKTLGFFVFNDTFYIIPDRIMLGEFPNSPENYDTLSFEFQSLGMGECCKEYQITKVYYNGSVYNVEAGKAVQLKKQQ